MPSFLHFEIYVVNRERISCQHATEYIPQERGTIIIPYLTNLQYIVLTKHEFRRCFPRRYVPRARTNERLVGRLVQTGSTIDIVRSAWPRIARSAESITAMAIDSRENLGIPFPLNRLY